VRPEHHSLDLYAGASLSQGLDALLCQLASHDAPVRAIDALEQSGSFQIGDDRLGAVHRLRAFRVMANQRTKPRALAEQ
jgi:hypothetical protein